MSGMLFFIFASCAESRKQKHKQKQKEKVVKQKEFVFGIPLVIMKTVLHVELLLDYTISSTMFYR